MDHEVIADDITVVMLTHNHGRVIRRALESVPWASEILVVDSGSSDDTIKHVQDYTNRITYFPNAQNKTAMLQVGVTQASFPWILLLSPDEWVSEALYQELQTVRKTLKNAPKSYWIPTQLVFLGNPINTPFAPWTDTLCRFFHREALSSSLFSPQPKLTENTDELMGRLQHPMYIEPFVDEIDLFQQMALQFEIDTGHLLEKGHWPPKAPHPVELIRQVLTIGGQQFLFQGGYRHGFPGFLLALGKSYGAWMSRLALRKQWNAHLGLEGSKQSQQMS